jgi:peptidoglycan/LPS O-acetylase OafA/YrhL
MVILVHTTGIGFGRFGVQLFFVISGFLLAEFFKTQSGVQFLVHRGFRLFPLSIFFILFFYLDKVGSPKDLLLNLTLFQNLWWSWNSFPAGWSISSEWIFSIILIAIVRRSSRNLTFLLMIICTLQLFSGLYVYRTGGVSDPDTLDYIFEVWINTTNPLINLGFFVAGILMKRFETKIIELKNYLLIIVISGMIMEDFIIGHFMLGWQFAIPALFVLCLKCPPVPGRAIYKFIGKRTYGIFFVHILIWNNLNIFFPDNYLEYLNSEPVGKMVQFLFVYLIAIIGGTFTYKFIERPFLKLSSKIVNKL